MIIAFDSLTNRGGDSITCYSMGTLCSAEEVNEMFIFETAHMGPGLTGYWINEQTFKVLIYDTVDIAPPVPDKTTVNVRGSLIKSKDETSTVADCSSSCPVLASTFGDVIPVVEKIYFHDKDANGKLSVNDVIAVVFNVDMETPTLLTTLLGTFTGSILSTLTAFVSSTVSWPSNRVCHIRLLLGVDINLPCPYTIDFVAVPLLKSAAGQFVAQTTSAYTASGGECAFITSTDVSVVQIRSDNTDNTAGINLDESLDIWFSTDTNRYYDGGAISKVELSQFITFSESSWSNYIGFWLTTKKLRIVVKNPAGGSIGAGTTVTISDVRHISELVEAVDMVGSVKGGFTDNLQPVAVESRWGRADIPAIDHTGLTPGDMLLITFNQATNWGLSGDSWNATTTDEFIQLKNNTGNNVAPLTVWADDYEVTFPSPNTMNLTFLSVPDSSVDTSSYILLFQDPTSYEPVRSSDGLSIPLGLYASPVSTGIFTPANLYVNVTEIDFGIVIVGDPVVKSFYIKNFDGCCKVGSSYDLSGSLEFEVHSDTSGSSVQALANGVKRTVGIKFSPSTSGVFVGTVTVSDEISGITMEIPLTGEGLAPNDLIIDMIANNNDGQAGFGVGDSILINFKVNTDMAGYGLSSLFPLAGDGTFISFFDSDGNRLNLGTFTAKFPTPSSLELTLQSDGLDDPVVGDTYIKLDSNMGLETETGIPITAIQSPFLSGNFGGASGASVISVEFSPSAAVAGTDNPFVVIRINYDGELDDSQSTITFLLDGPNQKREFYLTMGSLESISDNPMDGATHVFSVTIALSTAVGSGTLRVSEMVLSDANRNLVKVPESDLLRGSQPTVQVTSANGDYSPPTITSVAIDSTENAEDVTFTLTMGYEEENSIPFLGSVSVPFSVSLSDLQSRSETFSFVNSNVTDNGDGSGVITVSGNISKPISFDLFVTDLSFFDTAGNWASISMLQYALFPSSTRHIPRTGGSVEPSLLYLDIVSTPPPSVSSGELTSAIDFLGSPAVVDTGFDGSLFTVWIIIHTGDGANPLTSANLDFYFVDDSNYKVSSNDVTMSAWGGDGSQYSIIRIDAGVPNDKVAGLYRLENIFLNGQAASANWDLLSPAQEVYGSTERSLIVKKNNPGVGNLMFNPSVLNNLAVNRECEIRFDLRGNIPTGTNRVVALLAIESPLDAPLSLVASTEHRASQGSDTFIVPFECPVQMVEGKWSIQYMAVYDEDYKPNFLLGNSLAAISGAHSTLSVVGEGDSEAPVLVDFYREDGGDLSEQIVLARGVNSTTIRLKVTDNLDSFYRGELLFAHDASGKEAAFDFISDFQAVPNEADTYRAHIRFKDESKFTAGPYSLKKVVLSDDQGNKATYEDRSLSILLLVGTPSTLCGVECDEDNGKCVNVGGEHVCACKSNSDTLNEKCGGELPIQCFKIAVDAIEAVNSCSVLGDLVFDRVPLDQLNLTNTELANVCASPCVKDAYDNYGDLINCADGQSFNPVRSVIRMLCSHDGEENYCMQRFWNETVSEGLSLTLDNELGEGIEIACAGLLANDCCSGSISRFFFEIGDIDAAAEACGVPVDFFFSGEACPAQEDFPTEGSDCRGLFTLLEKKSECIAGFELDHLDATQTAELCDTDCLPSLYRISSELAQCVEQYNPDDQSGQVTAILKELSIMPYLSYVCTEQDSSQNSNYCHIVNNQYAIDTLLPTEVCRLMEDAGCCLGTLREVFFDEYFNIFTDNNGTVELAKIDYFLEESCGRNLSAIQSCDTPSWSFPLLAPSQVVAPTISLVELDNTGSSFTITFSSATNEPASSDCSALLMPATLTKIGLGANCRWLSSDELFVSLGAFPTIVVGDLVRVRSGAIASRDLDAISLELSGTLTAPSNSDLLTPVAIISGSLRLGSCNDLILDGSLSLGSFSRDFDYSWTVEPPGDLPPAVAAALETVLGDGQVLSQKKLVLPAEVTGLGEYHISLTVTNWLGYSDSTTFLVVKESSSLLNLLFDGSRKKTVNHNHASTEPIAVVEVLPSLCDEDGDENGVSPKLNLAYKWEQVKAQDVPASEKASLSPDYEDGTADVSSSIDKTLKTSRFLFLKVSDVPTEKAFYFKFTVENLDDATQTNSIYMLVQVNLPAIRVDLLGTNTAVSTAKDQHIVTASVVDDSGTSTTTEFEWDCLHITFLEETPADVFEALESGDASYIQVPCFDSPPTISGSEGASLSLDVHDYDEGSFLWLSVTATKGARSASSKGFLLVVEEDVPSVYLTLVDNNPAVQRPVVITASFDYSKSIQWSSLKSNLDLSTIKLETSLTSPYLVIKPGQLEPGTTYSISARVTDKNGASASASIKFTTRASIVTGTCDATKDGSTSVTLSCADFISPGGDELKYRFMHYLGTDANGRRDLVPLTLASTKTSTTLYREQRPYAPFTSDGNVTIIVSVKNEYGASSEYSFSYEWDIDSGDSVTRANAVLNGELGEAVGGFDLEGLVSGMSSAGRLLAQENSNADEWRSVTRSVLDSLELFESNVTLSDPDTLLSLMLSLYKISKNKAMDRSVGARIARAQRKRAEDALTYIKWLVDRGDADADTYDPTEFVSPLLSTLEEVLDRSSDNATYSREEYLESLRVSTLLQLSNARAGSQSRVTSSTNLRILTRSIVPSALADLVLYVLEDEGNDEASLVSVENSEENARVQLPNNIQDALNGLDVVKYSFVYSKLDPFGVNDTDGVTEQDLEGTERSPIKGGVVSFSFFSNSGDEVEVSGLNANESILISIPHTSLCNSSTDSRDCRLRVCRFWDTDRDLWSSEGCSLYSSNETFTTCSCTHLTDFSVDLHDLEPTISSLSAEDFENLTWDNLMDHPTTLITIAVTILLYILLLPVAHRLDKKYQRKYEYLTEGLVEGHKSNRGLNQGVLPAAAMMRIQDDDNDDDDDDDDYDEPGAVKPVSRVRFGRDVRQLSVSVSQDIDQSFNNGASDLDLLSSKRSAPTRADSGDASPSAVELVNLGGERNGEGDDVKENGDASSDNQADENSTLMDSMNRLRPDVANRNKDPVGDGNGVERMPSQGDTLTVPGSNNGSRKVSVSKEGEGSIATKPLQTYANHDHEIQRRLTADSREKEQSKRTKTWRQNKMMSTYVSEFRHRHLWLSVAFRHPRDRVNSVQRLSIVLAFVLGTMTINAAFFGTNKIFADLLVIIISSLAVVPATLILMFLFRGGSCDSRVKTKEEIARENLGLGVERVGCVARSGYKIAWGLWSVWCMGCVLLSLVYGLQFDLKNDDREDESGATLVAIGAATLTARWLISCGLANLQDIVFNRPLIIFFRTLYRTKCKSGAS